MKVTPRRATLLAAVACLVAGPLQTAAAENVTLRLKTGNFEIKGELVAADSGSYVVRTVEMGMVALEAARFDCFGKACPVSPGSRFGIHGSNTIGAQLMPGIVESYAARAGLQLERIVGDQPEEVTLRLASQDGRQESVIDLRSHGTGTGIPSLTKKESELAMLSRPMTAEEAKLLADAKLTAQSHIVALDGVVVFVSPQNPVQALSLEQIARIFAGEIKDWSELGGAPGRINIYARDDKSGTWDTFNSLVLRPLKLKISPEAKRFESSTDLSDETARDPNGIGFAGFAYLRNAKALAISSPCGIVSAPTTYQVKTEEYPLARRLFVYTSSAGQSDLARRILSFAMSDEATKAVEEAGFISLSIDAQSFEAQASRLAPALLVPDEDFSLPFMRQLLADIQGARRLSITFRFERNSAQLDERAKADIARLADFLQSPAARGKSVMLLGFSDSQGPFDANRTVALNRASSIRAAIAAAAGEESVRNVIAKGYGELLPVGCNTTEAGRDKNRRVEVWIKE